MKRVFSVIGNITIFAATLVIFFSLLEMTLRLTIYDFKDYPKSAGPNSTYEIRTAEYSHTVSTNNLNIRNRAILPKAKDEYRILCLGDSFTFGVGVDDDETYPKALEALLKKKSKNYFVINGGGTAFAGDHYHFLLKKGFALKPDLLICQVYIGNDFYDADKLLHEKRSLYKDMPLRGFGLALERWRTVDFIWKRLVQIRYIDELLFRLDLRYGIKGLFLKRSPILEKRLAGIEFAYLKRISELCARYGIEMLIVVIPAKEQVYGKYSITKWPNCDYKKPNKAIKNFCRRNDIYCIDFLDIYEMMSPLETADFYYKRDQHWTSKGHRHAAEVLSGVIARSHANSDTI